MAGNRRAPLVWPLQGGQYPHHRRLTCPVGPKQGKHGPRRDQEIDLVKNEVAAIGLRDPRSINCVFHTRNCI